MSKPVQWVGSGLHCCCNISVGTCVCDYVGRLMTDIEAVSCVQGPHSAV